MNDRQQPAWITEVTRQLDASARDIDAATLSRLNRARQAALKQPHRRTLSWWLPAGLASACAMVLAIGVWYAAPPVSVAPVLPVNAVAHEGWSGGVDDLDMVANEDNIELYQDLDFYAWLDAQDGDHDG